MAQTTKKDPEKSVIVPKTPAELQKLKLEKLMKNPAKEVFIPEPSQERKPRDPLEFIRNVWGSSAGAGSGDFHVYRGVRRREYARQKYLDEKFERDNADTEYQKKLEENQKAAEERTAKKRAKRLKKKQKQKGKKAKKEEQESDTESEEQSEDESQEISDISKNSNSDQNCDKGDNSCMDKKNNRKDNVSDNETQNLSAETVNTGQSDSCSSGSNET